MFTNEDQDAVQLNRSWEKRIKDAGADFVYFVDVSEFPEDITEGCTCAVLFGKALSCEYIGTLQNGGTPEHKDAINTERKMDALADMLAGELTAEGYRSIARLKIGVMPHKTAALRAGLGFIGKNNLLVTPEYGCALMLGKVLTSAPFKTTSVPPAEPQCGECNICVNACPTQALLGKTWSIGVTREEMITRKLCILCLRCMVMCPYTAEYLKKS